MKNNLVSYIYLILESDTTWEFDHHLTKWVGIPGFYCMCLNLWFCILGKKLFHVFWHNFRLSLSKSRRKHVRRSNTTCHTENKINRAADVDFLSGTMAIFTLLMIYCSRKQKHPLRCYHQHARCVIKPALFTLIYYWCSSIMRGSGAHVALKLWPPAAPVVILTQADDNKAPVSEDVLVLI